MGEGLNEESDAFLQRSNTKEASRGGGEEFFTFFTPLATMQLFPAPMHKIAISSNFGYSSR